MPIFEIEGSDGVYEIDAPDERAAVKAFQRVLVTPKEPSEPARRNADGTYGDVPEGMALNPRTGQMEDLQSSVNDDIIPHGLGTSAAYGVGQGLGFGLLDEAAAGASALFGGDYGYNLARMREGERRAAEDHPVAYYGGTVGGALGTGAALAGSGLSLGASAARAGEGLGRTAIGLAADGAILGGAQGFGTGEGVENRLWKTGVGALGGLAIGGATPFAVAGAQRAAQPVLAPLMARLRPDTYADRALGEGLRRAEMSADDVAGILERSRADGQDVFTVADAMGNSGQRMLSTIARTPNNERANVINTLSQRQMGQGERLANTLAEGFGAPDTAAQRAARLAAERTQIADLNYGAARQGADAVDVSGAIREADAVLTPGVTRLANPGSNIADDSLEGAIRRARSLLTDGNSQISDFNSVLRAKQDIADQIEVATRAGKGNLAGTLRGINRQLDSSLERASPAYRTANDTFRDQSRTIDAIDAGTAAASGRTRAADNIDTFNALRPAEQSAFRAGYADPMIAKVEAGAIAPTTNKARPLMTGKSEQEFPAFAIPRRADQMGRRIAREQRMFETANAAMGGSKTADNLADAAEMAKFDPSVLTALFTRGPVDAVVKAASSLVHEAQGLPPSVMERLARTLLETSPDAAREMVRRGASQAAVQDGRRALANTILLNMSAAGAGRLPAP